MTLPFASIAGSRHPGRAACAFCGRRLTVHEEAVGRVCAGPACGRRQLAALLADRARETAVLRRRLARLRARTARARPGAALESLPLAVLPSNDRRVVNLPERRRRAFRDYLTRSISGAVGRRGGAAAREAGPAAAPAGAESLALAQGCATCRGHCCQAGGEHAFLNVEKIGDYLRRHPGLRPRQVLEAYLARLPARSYEGACVFQAAGGCALPREMRSQICNDYYCKGLGELRASWPEGAASFRAFAGAFSNGRVVRAAVLDGARPPGVEAGAVVMRAARAASGGRTHPAAGILDGRRDG